MTHRIQIAGVEFDRVSYEQALDRVDILMQSQGQYYGVTANPEMLLNASKDNEFRKILNGSALSVADGIGVIWAAYFLKKTIGKSRLFKWLFLPLSLLMIFFAPARLRSVLPQRVTGADLFLRIIERSQEHLWRIFLLGAAPGVAQEVTKKLRQKYPKVEIVGEYAGSPKKEDWPEAQKHIQKSEPDLLFVAYGSPAQEKWIAEHLKNLPSVRFAMGIGGTFDFVAGKIKRAPKIFQALGLEWLWRLFLQPSRFSRIINATWRFIGLIFRNP